MLGKAAACDRVSGGGKRMSADVGSKAPDFTLPNQDRQPVRLQDEVAKSNVVLAFFPAAFSSVCTKELCTFRDQLGALNHLAKAQVLGISVDTPFSLKAFGNAERLQFPLLSDFNKDVIRAYEVFNADMIGLKGISKRAVFVIDRQGTVRYKEVLDDARNEPNYEQLNGALAAL
jgi:glutaredoxin-dependent peroxiredoxin